MFNKIIGVVTFIPRKLYNYTEAINVALQAPLAIKDKMTASEIFYTRLIGTTSSSVLFAKGAKDAATALVCQDGVCFVISCIGCAADSLGFVANFVPGPNVTQIVTVSISAGCKTFVWCCKGELLPWKKIC